MGQWSLVPLLKKCITQVPQFHDVFRSSVLQTKTTIELRTNLALALSSSPAISNFARRSLDQLTRHVRLFGKFFRKLQQVSVPRFVALPMSNDLVLYYWSNIVQATDGPPELIAGMHPPSLLLWCE